MPDIVLPESRNNTQYAGLLLSLKEARVKEDQRAGLEPTPTHRRCALRPDWWWIELIRGHRMRRKSEIYDCCVEDEHKKERKGISPTIRNN